MGESDDPTEGCAVDGETDGATDEDAVGISEIGCCVVGSAVTGDADDGATEDGRSVDGLALTGGADTDDGKSDGVATGVPDGFSTGFELGNGDTKVLLANPIGSVQLGDTGCAHCLYGLLLHTAPGSQHTVSSVQACA